MLQDESFPNDEILDKLDFTLRVEHTSLSTNGRTSSALSSKTAKSDPTGLAENESKNPNNQNKAVSYHDVHSDYTKRRYKHVASKVREYINNIKVEDKKRQNTPKFKRHCSVPETCSLLDTAAHITATTGTRHGIMSYSAGELHKLDESTSDLGITDSSENSTGIASGSRSSSSQGRHDSSDDAVTDGDYIDHLAYAQLVNEKERLQSYSEYQQMRLDEKTGEVIRLRQNVDYLRIELNKCQDKLRKQAEDALGSSSALNALVRQSMQTLPLYDYCETKSTKAIQTDFKTPLTPQPPACNIFVTPDTPDTSKNTTNSRVDIENDSDGLEKLDQKRTRKRRNLRRRWLNFFVPCTSCNNPNQTLSDSSTLQQTFAQIPLLEKSFDHCRNMR